MTLAALISAHHEAEPGTLRATLPLAGRSLVERQARLAAAAGCAPIVLLVERIAPELLAAVDRLRREALPVTIARSAAEAASLIGTDGRVLLVADGLVAGQHHFSRIAHSGSSALLILPDVAFDDRYERIDGHTRWAGLALVESQLLTETAEKLGDWDLVSTLLRRAVQGGARELAIRGEVGEGELVVAARSEHLGAAEAALLSSIDAPRGSWASRYLLAPLERTLTRLLLPSRATPLWLQLAAALLTAFAAFCFARLWLWPGLVALLLATPLPGLAERLGDARLQAADRRGWWRDLLPVLDAAALLALGSGLAGPAGWGTLVLAVAALLFLLALHVELRGEVPSGAIWLAEPIGMAWLLLPFAAVGYWAAGIGALALYAAGSFFWAQRAAHRPVPPGDQD